MRVATFEIGEGEKTLFAQFRICTIFSCPLMYGIGLCIAFFAAYFSPKSHAKHSVSVHQAEDECKTCPQNIHLSVFRFSVFFICPRNAFKWKTLLSTKSTCWMWGWIQILNWTNLWTSCNGIKNFNLFRNAMCPSCWQTLARSKHNNAAWSVELRGNCFMILIVVFPFRMCEFGTCFNCEWFFRVVAPHANHLRWWKIPPMLLQCKHLCIHHHPSFWSFT